MAKTYIKCSPNHIKLENLVLCIRIYLVINQKKCSTFDRNIRSVIQTNHWIGCKTMSKSSPKKKKKSLGPNLKCIYFYIGYAGFFYNYYPRSFKSEGPCIFLDSDE